MNKKINKLFPYLILISGFIISICAAVFSIDGFSKFFAGASVKIMIVTGAMELCKLVITSALKLYWNKFSWSLRIPALIFTIILVYLTSIGLYGFLSAAYQETSTKNSIAEKEITLLESKTQRFKDLKLETETEKNSIINDINSLRSNLSEGSKTEYVDRKSGQKISSASTTTMKIYETQLKDATARRDDLTLKIDNLNDSINTIEIQVLEKRSQNTASLDLGPMIYVQKITGWDIDKIANILILSLMIVFDPLAISMLLMAITVFTSHKDIVNEPTEVENKTVDEIVQPVSSITEPEKVQTDQPVPNDNNSVLKDIINEINDDNKVHDPIVDLEDYFTEQNVKNQNNELSKSKKKSQKGMTDEEHKFYHGKRKLSKNEEKNMTEWQKKNIS